MSEIDGYAPGIAEALERNDWTPIEALQWYAAGNHYDTMDNRTRIIDTGAIASNALKHASLQHLKLKGDAELHELSAENERLHSRVAELEWQIEILIAQRDAAYTSISGLEEMIGNQQDELNKLKTDAERYRWLREQAAEKGIAVLNITGWERAATCLATTYPDSASLDDAIDAAMAAHDKQSEGG